MWLPRTQFWFYTFVIAACWAAAHFCTGCTSVDPVWYVDDRFTPAEEQQIQAAVDTWADATGTRVHFDLVFGQHVRMRWDQHHVLYRATEQEAATAPWDALHDPGTSGLTISVDDVRQTIVLVPTRFATYGASLSRVLVHELGHAIGLQHVPDPTSVMHPTNPAGDQMVNNRCLPALDLHDTSRLVDLEGAQLWPCR